MHHPILRGALRVSAAMAAMAAMASMVGAGCSYHGDLDIQGEVTSATTLGPIAGATIVLSYEPESPFDLGLLMSSSDSAGRYALRASNVPCRRLSLAASASGYDPAPARVPSCRSGVQRFDFALRPSGGAIAYEAPRPAHLPPNQRLKLACVSSTACEAQLRTCRPSCSCTGDQDKAANTSRHSGDGFLSESSGSSTSISVGAVYRNAP